MKDKKKKSFYKVRQFRLSDKNYARLLNIKKGTWNFTITNLIKKILSNKEI